MPATLTSVLDEVTNLITKWTAHDEDFSNWLAGTITGGFNQDGTPSNGVAPNGGYYPLRNASGQSLYFPCPAKLASQMMRGDDATTDIPFNALGVMSANEMLGGIIFVGNDTTLDASRSKGLCLGVPASERVITVKRTRAGVTVDMATVTFAAGSDTAVVAITAPDLKQGDLIRFYAPPTHDAAFTDVFITLAGSN